MVQPDLLRPVGLRGQLLLVIPAVQLHQYHPLDQSARQGLLVLEVPWDREYLAGLAVVNAL